MFTYYSMPRPPGFFENQNIASGMLELIQREVQRVIQDSITSSMEYIFQHLHGILNDFRNNISPFMDFRINLDSNYVIDSIQTIRITIRWRFEEGISDYEINYSMNMGDIAAMSPMLERTRGGISDAYRNYRNHWGYSSWMRQGQEQVQSRDQMSREEIRQEQLDMEELLEDLQEIDEEDGIQQQQEENNNSSSLPDHLFEIE